MKSKNKKVAPEVSEYYRQLAKKGVAKRLKKIKEDAKKRKAETKQTPNT